MQGYGRLRAAAGSLLGLAAERALPEELLLAAMTADPAREDEKQVGEPVQIGEGPLADVREALLSLGLTAQEASEALRNVDAEGRAPEELLKEALRKVPAGSSRPAANTMSKPSEPARRWTSRIAAGRGADRVELSDLLYWKK